MVVMSIVRYLRGPAGLCKSFKEQQKAPVALDKTSCYLGEVPKGGKRRDQGGLGRNEQGKNGEEVG